MAEKHEINTGKEARRITLDEVLGSILSNNVNISDAEYEKMLGAVAENYDKNQKNGEKSEMPTLAERRERIKMNFYGSAINFLFQILNTVNDFYKNYTPLIEAIAEKVGVEFEKVQSEEDKAMQAVAEYLKAGAEKRKAEAQALNREQRRKAKKDNVVKFASKENK